MPEAMRPWPNLPAASSSLPAERPQETGAEVPFEELLAQISRAKGRPHYALPAVKLSLEEAAGAPSASDVPHSPPPRPASPRFLPTDGVVRVLEPNPGYLTHGRDLTGWEMDRVMTPERTWPSGGSALIMFHDHQREGLPAWRPSSWSHKGECFPYRPPKPRRSGAARRPASGGPPGGVRAGPRGSVALSGACRPQRRAQTPEPFGRPRPQAQDARRARPARPVSVSS